MVPIKSLNRSIILETKQELKQIRLRDDLWYHSDPDNLLSVLHTLSVLVAEWKGPN